MASSCTWAVNAAWVCAVSLHSRKFLANRCTWMDYLFLKMRILYISTPNNERWSIHPHIMISDHWMSGSDMLMVFRRFFSFLSFIQRWIFRSVCISPMNFPPFLLFFPPMLNFGPRFARPHFMANFQKNQWPTFFIAEGSKTAYDANDRSCTTLSL